MDTVTDTSWLSDEQLELMRAHVPVVYVEAVPVRVDALGNVTRIGLLLRVANDGSISRLIVSGRVKFGERVLGLPKEPGNDRTVPFSQLPKNA